LVLYVSDALLYPLVIAGVFLSLSEIGGSVGRVVWGIVSDRFFGGERVPVLILIAVITAVCGISAAFLPPKASLWILVPLVILFGFCIAGFNGIWMNFASESVPHEYAGIASGFSLSIGSIGVIFGPPMFGLVVDMTGGYTISWLLVSLQMVAVIGLLIWAKHRQHLDSSDRHNPFSNLSDAR
jgi:sugar phosphate permease